MSGLRGRPRAFDEDQALENALRVFWKHGFQGAALSELTEAMGLSKPSLYAAFGDKEQLYLKALARYRDERLAPPVRVLSAEGEGRAAVEAYLRSMAKLFADPAMPGGCFIVNGLADTGGTTTPPGVQQALQDALRGAERLLRQRIEQAARDGELPVEAAPAQLAGLFVSVLCGLAVQAKSGEPLSKLRRVIDSAMAAWPAAPRG
ncbi:TetR/AcrR family transcriptional regulator [Schlegelella sp. S2-27]|uniref:TetR/AcrR family transcriptional regulator n=1 Tax=Caldimonas mangrovi TaxID=2944811 RepID=A0ABT0YLL7_9BURK|nr:TetR/AcrR family transcriptional regulator [Caldimonas mangrovi]MCM5679626.1 TetR/AcrR family transcriptional regulator [Caldimonas mangrovi]